MARAFSTIQKILPRNLLLFSCCSNLWNLICFSSYSNTTERISLSQQLLQECRSMGELFQILARLITTGLFKSPFHASRILKLSSEFDDIDYSLLIFRQIELPDTFTVNTIIKCYSLSDDPYKAVVIYFEMLRKGFVPNSFTFPPLLKSCAKASSVHNGETCHGQVVKIGVYEVVHVCNSLIHMYVSCGLLGCSRQVFDEMIYKDLISWNVIIDGYVKLGDLLTARNFFDEMPERNVVSWNVMITGYLKYANPGHGLKIFREMCKIGLKGNLTTMVSVLTACGRSARLKEGRSIHGFLVKNFFEINHIVETSLVNMYSKCHRVEVARRVFDEMPSWNLISWNAMILGYCIHGNPEDGLALFEEMKNSGFKTKNGKLRIKNVYYPDEVTFVGVLCACARKGSLSEGEKYFQQMINLYNISPNFAHYWCIANLYNSVGLTEEAEKVLSNIHTGQESQSWSSLLGLCRFRGDIELGERIGTRLIELEPHNGSRYSVLWNVYAVAGQWDNVAKVKKMMMKNGIRTLPGCCLLDLNQIVHNFEVGDRKNPQIEKIYMMVNELVSEREKLVKV